MITQPFETKRMLFRLLNKEDAEVICRQFSDSDMCKYFHEPPCDLEEAKGIITHYQDPVGKGYLRYGMFDKETAEFIGTCGYHYYDPQVNQVELGYDIWKAYWKQGYMTEAMPELIRICFEYLDVNRIYIFTHQDNIASQKSVSKFGFQLCEPCRTPDADTQVCMKLDRE